MPEILGWQPTGDPERIVQRAVQTLTEGQVVAFPTETVYGLAAASWLPEAVERLAACKGRADQKPMALAIRGPEAVRDWVPEFSKIGWRLARRCWPGPVTLVCDVDNARGRVGQLPESIRRWVCPAGALGLRVPDHEAIWQTLQLLPGPLVLTSANPSGQAEATTADEVARTLRDRLALIIDGGPSFLGRASTVVRMQGDNWKILREGVVSAADLRWLSACMIVFVCTGNTCRSPLAEALCKKMLAETLGCSVADLPERGFLIGSAGLAAYPGGRAAPEAMEVARSFGADLSDHETRLVNRDMVFQADYLIAMTQSHVETLVSRYPATIPRVLSPDGSDIPDPVACELPVYLECARLLQQHLEPLIRELIAEVPEQNRTSGL
jgi:tRNA threonylcarbamoyl adenosine modification protein (Sua5/YciO/YrdC/YwlC family)